MWLAIASSFISIPYGIMVLLAAFAALIGTFKASLAVGLVLLLTGIAPSILMMAIYCAFGGLWLVKEYLDDISNPFERHIKALGIFLGTLIGPYLALLLYELISNIGINIAN